MDRNDIMFLSLWQTVYEQWPKMSEMLGFCAVAPPLDRFGQAFSFLGLTVQVVLAADCSAVTSRMYVMYVLPRMRKVHACAHAQFITIIPGDGFDGSKSISISYAVLTIVLLC